MFERAGRPNTGRALETAVLLELERRGCDIGYVRTGDGYEVDFRARDPEGRVFLLQVTADITDPETYQREVRALVSAAAEHRNATPVLLTAEAQPPGEQLPAPLRWQTAAAWLLGDELTD